MSAFAEDNQVSAMQNVTEEGGKGVGEGEVKKETGGLTVAEPFAASLVASLTEQDVNESPPIMYILKELLTFLVRFGLSIGARKTLGLNYDEEAFNSTSVELFYVKLCKDNTLRVNAAIALNRHVRGTERSATATKLPLTIRLGLDLEEGGRCIIVRQPELVTTGLFRREVYVPFMPLAKSGADLGPDLHLSKLQVKEGIIEAEGIVVVRPPTTLTVEQEISLLQGGGVAEDSEIDELRRAEMQTRELDSREKGSQVDRQRMQVESEIRMSRWRAAERRRLRYERVVTVRNATRKALSPLDNLRSQINVTAMSSYVNTSAYAAYMSSYVNTSAMSTYVNITAMSSYVNTSAMSSYVNTSAYAAYLRGRNVSSYLYSTGQGIGAYSANSTDALRVYLNTTLHTTASSLSPLVSMINLGRFTNSLQGAQAYSLAEAVQLERKLQQVQQRVRNTNATGDVTGRKMAESVYKWATSREMMRSTSLVRDSQNSADVSISTTSLIRAMSPQPRVSRPSTVTADAAVAVRRGSLRKNESTARSTGELNVTPGGSVTRAAMATGGGGGECAGVMGSVAGGADIQEDSAVGVIEGKKRKFGNPFGWFRTFWLGERAMTGQNSERESGFEVMGGGGEKGGDQTTTMVLPMFDHDFVDLQRELVELQQCETARARDKQPDSDVLPVSEKIANNRASSELVQPLQQTEREELTDDEKGSGIKVAGAGGARGAGGAGGTGGTGAGDGNGGTESPWRK